MIRPARLATVFAAVLALGAGGAAFAQSTYNPKAEDLSGSLQSEETGSDLRPLPLGCVAIAVDANEGGEGNGTGKTQEAAEKNAIELCVQSGGKKCVVETSACNPDG